MTDIERAAMLASATPDGTSGKSYLSRCPSLAPELAQLAEDSDHRPLMRGERAALDAAIYACACAIRRRRPALVHAAIEGRLE